MAISIKRFPDGKSFLDRARSWLGESEVVHSLMIGIATRLVDGPAGTGQEPYLATVEENGQIVACGLRMPPNKALLTRGNRPTLTALAEDLLAVYGTLPVVLGPVPEVDDFGRILERLTGARASPGMHQRAFECRTVEIEDTVRPGHLASAKKEDLDRVVGWILDARKANRPYAIQEDVRAEAERMIGSGDLFFWCDPKPVSMVARSLRTFTGITINHVYTPPELRCRGYATAGVLSLTRRLLNDGYGYCSLFTDVANPTSNSIYQKIGYRPVCDMRDVVFEST